MLVRNRLNHMLLVLLVLLLLSGVALAQETPGTYVLANHDLPTTVAPGQTVIGHLTWKVITPGQPAFTGPVVDFVSTGANKRGMRLPGEKFTPWSFPTTQKPGDLLKTTFTLDIPLDFPSGPASIALLLARNVPGKGWQYANVQDEDGKLLGDAFRWSLTVKGDATASTVTESPLVIKSMSAPTIDGKLGDGEWAAATMTPAFRENIAGGAPKASTRAYIGHDTTNLYVAYVCQEPKLATAVRTRFEGRDPSVWNNECVELFLDPQGDRVSFMHFIVDILNQRHDLLGNDSYGFNPAWKNAVGEGKGEWTVEVAIPFSSLGVASPKPGDVWYGNLCRERKVESELSAWLPTYGSFEALGRFGLLVFDDLKQYLNKRLAALTPLESYPAALQEAAAKWQAQRDAWQTQLDGLDASGTTAAYPQLAADIGTLQTDLERLKMKAAALSGQGVILTQTAPYAVFTGQPAASDTPAGPLQLQALANEWLDLAWNLTNPTDKPVTLRLALHPGDPAVSHDFLLFGLPGIQHQWRLATAVATADDRPIYDALVPLPAGTVIVAPGETAQVWLSLKAGPALADATGYVRVERIDGGGGTPTILPISLQTIPTDIRSPQNLHCFTWNVLRGPAADNREWFEAHLADLAEHGVDVLAIHGLTYLPRVKANADGTLAEPLDFTRVNNFLAIAKPYFGLYYVTMDIWEKNDVRRDLFDLDFDTPAYERAFKTWFAAVRDNLLAQGLTRDQLLINPYDESVGEKCQKLASWIKAVDPQLKIIIDSSTSDIAEARQMNALTDVWVPHYKYHFADDHKEFFDMLKASGKPHWCYYYSEGGNEKAQDPLRYTLGKFWWAYAQGITGMCYWAQQYYGDPWYRADYRAAYDTSLVYPMESGPCASRRWEAWRRGWQDYQLLALTKAKLTAAKDEAGLRQLQQLVEGAVTVPGNPAKTEAVRQWARGQLTAQ